MNHYTPVDDNKMNSNYQRILKNNQKSADADGEDVKDIPNFKLGVPSGKPTDTMHTDLMTWTDLLESMDAVAMGIDRVEMGSEDIMDSPMSTSTTVSISSDEPDKDLMEELNQIFTPILVMQGFEENLSDRIQEAFSEASVLMEQNVIQFDDATRYAQLVSVCALLIARKKNTPEYQMYAKAATIRNKMKLDIQKKEYDEARTLAQKYLVNVSSTNNSSVARAAANDLLPETQR